MELVTEGGREGLGGGVWRVRRPSLVACEAITFWFMWLWDVPPPL